MEENYIVYVKVDAQNRIVEINSSAFVFDTTGWAPVDDGTGDKYHHAQGNYLNKPLVNIDGAHNYKWINKKIVETTVDEKNAELSTFVKPVSDIERLQAQIDDILITIVGGAV